MSYIHISGFVLGTFKFLFAHWTMHYTAVAAGEALNFLEIFIPTTIGGLLSAAVFYFLSDYFMERAAKKRRQKLEAALLAGVEPKKKRNFTWLNKLLVSSKRTLGIYGTTLIAPLFFSVPIGSIICAKFYGNKRMTFPLMAIFMSSYSLIMCSVIQLIG